MDWKKWLSYSIYKKLWSVLGKRPWTFIYRDVWHKLEWFPQMQWAVTGIVAEYARQLMGWPWWFHLVWAAVYTYGYINGHFFWADRYIEGQKGE